MLKSKIKLLLLSTFLFMYSNSFSQNIRGVYLSGITDWLGNHTMENVILDYVKGNGYNYIALYSLNTMNWNGNGQQNKLASFIKKARTQYNVTQVGAVLETYSFLRDYILPYNNQRTNANEKFDVVNQEFEFWITASIVDQYAVQYLIPNGYSIDSAGAFAFSWKELQKLDTACAHNGLISEVYLGWPTRGQMQKIVSKADRILLHSYRPDETDLYAYSKQRLMDIASVNSTVKVIPIFSAEPIFMGPWLSSNPLAKAYDSFATDFTLETDSFANNIDLQGFQWFTYGYMPKTVTPNAFITANGPIAFCQGGSVQLTANTGLTYKWTPGNQTTQTITVSNPGSYKVKVKNTDGNTYTSAPTVVAYTTTATAPLITTSGSINFCIGGNITLTSSQASSYLWTNGATTRSITVGNAGQYKVTTGNGSCSAISPVVNVTVSIPQIPTVNASGSLTLCQGKTVTLISSSAGGYLWSNGATTRSIVVSTDGDYTVRGYSGSNCYETSSINTVNVMQAPPRPVITTNGSTTLTPSHADVTLLSSYGTSYNWSNGNTTRQILVDEAGSYRVSITGSNGCSATSYPTLIKTPNCIPPPAPSITIQGSPLIVNGTGVELTSNTGNGYRWSNGETTQSITVSQPGNYTVAVFNGPNCFSTSLPVNITSQNYSGARLASEISTESSGEQFRIYPNPASNIITIEFNAGQSSNEIFNVYDLSSRVVKRDNLSVETGNNKLTIDISELPSGIYFAGMREQLMKLVIQ